MRLFTLSLLSPKKISKYGRVLVSYNSTDVLVAFLARVSLLIKNLTGCKVYNLQFIKSLICSLLSLSHISLGLLEIFSLDCLIAKPIRKRKDSGDTAGLTPDE